MVLQWDLRDNGAASMDHALIVDLKRLARDSCTEQIVKAAQMAVDYAVLLDGADRGAYLALLGSISLLGQDLHNLAVKASEAVHA